MDRSEYARKNTTRSLRQILWLRLIPRGDLNIVHHALRLILQHPDIAKLPEAYAIEHLADRVWHESTRRTS